MRSFCIIEAKNAKQALNNGIIVKRANIFHTKKECITNLNKISYKSGGAVIFEIHDKIASEDFDEELVLSAEDISPVDPKILDVEDILAKRAYDYTLKSGIIKTANINGVLNELSEKDSETFIKEYTEAFIAAKKENIKNAKQIATMMALKKVGNNAS